VSLAVAASVFVLLFPAELPDKTGLASLILGSRYRPGFVFAGVAAAFALHVVFAVAVGSLLTLLPHRGGGGGGRRRVTGRRTAALAGTKGPRG
jgi:putative Ca2+/H+ antiporter (TMEM165/GDT1 family)